jgi:SOS-response transcriptional repressor LexA
MAMQETKISIQEAFSGDLTQGIASDSSCSESEPFALQALDDSMEPEFATGCIIIIDPTGLANDGAYVFAKDNGDEYIFRQLRIVEGRYYLAPLNDLYETFEIKSLKQVEGVITQRAGKKRSYHKNYN